MADSPCDGIRGSAREYCERGQEGGQPPKVSGGGGLTDGASEHVKDLAETLLKTLTDLLAPNQAWAPKSPDSWIYSQFMWLGQHLAIAVFVGVVVVCALTSWQGAPRLRQLGASTGWTLAAVAGMAAVPGAVMLLNAAVSEAFKTAFNSNELTLLGTISDDLEHATDAGNPLASLLIIAVLVVSLALAVLVFLTRQLGILAFVLMAPLVLASLARGGDPSAVRMWANRLLGLMFAPFALLAISPLVGTAKAATGAGSLAMDAVLLVAVDVLMLRLIFHGVPYIGPRVAGAVRTVVERRTADPLARNLVRAGVPDYYERENTPRGPRMVDTPRRALTQDRGVLLAAFGVTQDRRPGRLTTASAVKQVRTDAARTAQIVQARRQARAAAQPPAPATSPASGSPDRARPASPSPRTPAPRPPAPPAPPPSGA
ncbi:hypothetical protein AB0N31_26335 [Streptomyces sp. NPDC051051]|uniref:hypothetical protein n=1 Tax=Streptomyces sp. NPDC051051 TaxID=3155666 RepID=UPI003431E3C2